MPDFIANENRDAWNVIRGYVYQVDLTLLRWLNLPPGSVLELERGEDIDLAPAVIDTGGRDERLLEQIKHVEGSTLTLRSARAVEAIANAIEHRQKNPDWNIVFRFSTNARPGLEQLSPFRPRTGVQVWEAIRRGDLAEDALHNALTGVRQILEDVPQPEGMSENTWNGFKAFFNDTNDEPLFELIRSFEWSPGQIDAGRVSERVIEALIRTGRSGDQRAARELYERLFLFVFKLLTHRGTKRLTVDDLAGQAALPTLSAHDHDLLIRLQALLHHLEARVTSLEQFVGHMSGEVTAIAAQMGILSRLTFGPSPPMLDVPALAEQASLRAANVESIMSAIKSHPWVAIHGAVQSGKTQLAVLITQAGFGEIIWLRCRGMNSATACRLIDVALAMKSGIAPTIRRAAWLDQACHALGESTALVLDDLPGIVAGDELCERLTLLVQSCDRAGVHLLTLSAHPLPESFRRQIGNDLHFEQAVTRMTTEETLEMMVACEAPESFVQPGWPETITALGHSHPGVIATIISYLKGQGWEATPAQIGALFQRDYATGPDGETLDRLANTVQDEQTRELLYRLGLAQNAFTFGDVQALAEIPPAVNRPRERLRALSGLWVQGEQDRWQVSALVRGLGESDLEPETRRGCFRVLAERITRRESMSQFQALQAFIYFRRADEYERGAAIHALLLSDFLVREAQEEEAQLVLAVLNDKPLETQISLGLRIYIRSMQIALFKKYGRATGFLVNDLDGLMQQTDRSHGSAILAAAVLAGPAILETRPASTFAYLRQAFEAEVEMPNGEDSPFPPGFAPDAGLIWTMLANVRTADALRAWLDFYEQLSPERRQRVASGGWAQTGAMAFAGRLLTVEWAKPEPDREWRAVSTVLEEFAAHANRLGFDLLWSNLRRSHLIMLAEIEGDLDGAVELARASLAGKPDDPLVTFLIAEYIGERYCAAGNMTEATRWLDLALASQTDAYPSLRSRGLLHASWAGASTDPKKSVAQAQSAVGEARRAVDLPPTETIRALAELAVALWASGESMTVVFRTWDRAAEELFAARDDGREWKSFFVPFAHVTGYFGALALNGRPLERTADGRSYRAPEPGMFLREPPGVEVLHTRNMELAVLAHLSTFARAAEDAERARDWMLRGLEADRGWPESLGAAKLGFDHVPYLVEEHRFSDALDGAMRFAVVAVASPLLTVAGADLMSEAVDFRAALGDRRGGPWAQAETLAFQNAMWPVAVHLCQTALTDRVEAQRHASDLARLCRSQAPGSAVPELWDEAASLFETFLDTAATPDVLIARSNALAGAGNQDVAVLACLFASVHPAVRLADALRLHLYVTPLVARNVPVTLQISRGGGITDFLLRFWRGRFDGGRFNFRKPGDVDRQLAGVTAQPADRQNKVLLRTIANGLGQDLPPGADSWLDS